MPKNISGKLVSVRLPADLARRVESLIPKLSRDTSVATLGQVSRSTVVKLAVLRGVEALEKQYR